MSNQDDSDREAEPPNYAFKPSLAGSVHRFRLAPDALEWDIGLRSGRIPYDEIRRVRLSFKPLTLQPHRYLTEIWSTQTPKLSISSSSWRSMFEQERLDAPYLAFVTDLHRRLRAAAPQARYSAGSPAVLYWIGLAIFVGLAIALAWLGIRAVTVASWEAVALVFGMMALFVWQTGNFFRRNRPQSYHPDSLPSQVLPMPR